MADDYAASGDSTEELPLEILPIFTNPPPQSSSPFLFEVVLAVSCVILLGTAMVFIWYKNRREKRSALKAPERLVTSCPAFDNQHFGTSMEAYAGSTA